MGACTFQHTVLGKGLTAQKAYTTLVSKAMEQHGLDAYNGTISTTEGFVMVDLPKGRTLDGRIDEILMEKSVDFQNIQKWGPAGCIELKSQALGNLKKGTKYAGTRARGFCFFGWAAE